MSNLTKENAKQHCRTCLIKINIKENDVVANAGEYVETESKDICINITRNNELYSLINKYITEPRLEEHIAEEYPQHVCLSCFDKLQQVDEFLTQAQHNADKLYKLITSAANEEKLEEGDNIYKLLLRDTLMEPETVLLDTIHNNELRHNNEDINNPDPFSANTEFAKNDILETTESSDNDNDWETNSIVSSLSENVHKTKPATRSTSKNIAFQALLHERTVKSAKKMKSRTETENNLSDDHTTKEKKKRRTKKEMEAYRNEQIEKIENSENKIKRRQKGTKNNFKCTHCNHCFAHKITLEAHVRKVHEGQSRPYKCDRCEKSYTFIGGLYTHIKEVHDVEERSHTCDFPNCTRTYTSLIAMQKHKRLKHTQDSDIKKYVCEQCGATFNQSCNLRYHRRSKHPTEAEKEKKANAVLYECEICKKFFHTRYTLKYHTMQLHSTEMKYECNICHRKMAKKFMLAQHMLVHSTDKTPCEHCGKLFIRKFELEAHVRAVHMKLKPFECKYCTESFASRKTLRHHQYIHTGEKPYVCDFPSCNKAYRQPTCLKNHRKTHEKIGAALTQNLVSSLITSGPQNKSVESINSVDTIAVV